MSSDDQNLIELLGPREVIGQAIDLLIAREDVSRDAAFELLVERSSTSSRKVRQVAVDIVRQREGP